MTSRALLDTSYFIALERDRPVDRASIPEALSISVVTVGELRQGVLAADDVDERAIRLQTLSALGDFDPLPVDITVAANWAALRVKLQATRLNLRANDLWIAATAVAYQVPLVTQVRDFVGVPGLEVILV